MFNKNEKGARVFPAESFLVEAECIYSSKEHTKMEEKK